MGYGTAFYVVESSAFVVEKCSGLFKDTKLLYR